MSGQPRHFFAAAAAIIVVVALSSPAQAQLVRGPYLQQTTPTSVRIKWRTASATDSVVTYGSTAQNLSERAESSAPTTEHEVLIEGLQPDTRYYYSVGDTSTEWAGGAGFYFETAPPVGNQDPTRIWVLGDSGTANSSARAVRDAYLDWANQQAPDLWLMLGDNAYNDGTDSQYQAAVFDMYPTVLRRVALWSTLGNHDGHSADSASMQGPYYDIFSLPQNAEAGGVASGTEAYYSFDYANIHFICLDSYDTDRSLNGAMANWLRDDLNSTTQQWVIAFWHHPPYTKGSHDSDREGRLIDMRENFLPILEAHGVDLVLSGHSHSYERSYLLDGHYGDSSTFSSNHLVDDGDGRVDGDGAYRKQAGPNLGAVYAVPGSSGKISGGSLDHPAMFVALNELGSMILDVRGNRLEASFLNSDGVISDHFTLEKGPDELAPKVVSVAALSETEVEVIFDEPIDATLASDPANWDVNGGVDVHSAVLASDETSVTLSTSPLDRNVLYELTISRLADRHQNEIAAPIVREFALADIETMSFRDGQFPTQAYAGTTDTKIKSDDPTSNFGTSEELETDGDPDYGVLMRWDVSALPEDVELLSASISLQITNDSGHSYDVLSVRRDWSENEATWQEYRAGQPWEAAGARGTADHDAQALGTVSGPSTGPRTATLAPAALELIEQWRAEPSTNHGFLFASYDDASDGLDFSSRETSTVEHRPMLTVEYRPKLRRADDETGGDAGDAGATSDAAGTPDASGSSDAATVDNDAQPTSDLGNETGTQNRTNQQKGQGCACRSASGTPAPIGWLSGGVLLFAVVMRRRSLRARA